MAAKRIFEVLNESEILTFCMPLLNQFIPLKKERIMIVEKININNVRNNHLKFSNSDRKVCSNSQ